MMGGMNDHRQLPLGKAALLTLGTLAAMLVSFTLFAEGGRAWAAWWTPRFGSAVMAVRDSLVRLGVRESVGAIAVLAAWRTILLASTLGYLTVLLRAKQTRDRALAGGGILIAFMMAADGAAAPLLAASGMAEERAVQLADTFASAFGIWIPMVIAVGYLLYESHMRRTAQLERGRDDETPPS